MDTISANEWLHCGSCNCYLPSLSSYQTHFLTRHKTGNELTASRQTFLQKYPEPSQVLKLVQCQVIISKIVDFCQMEHASDKHPNAKKNEPITRCSSKKIGGRVNRTNNGRSEPNRVVGPWGRNRKCHICHEVFSAPAYLERHIITRHTKEKPFECDQCGARFSRSDSLKSHMRMHSDKLEYDCDQCGNSFRFKSSLASHINVHHKSEEERKKFRCDLCPSRFITRNRLAAHKEEVHAMERVRKFQCDLCPKRLDTMASLKMHIMIHTGEKPYRCDLCPRAFAQESNLRTHKKTHGGNQPRPFSCDKCDKTYVGKCELNMHIKSFHDKLERFWCSICNKGFLRKQQLTQHIPSHLEERLHKCDFCGKSFKQESVLRLHMKIHLNEKHYSCQECGKGFVQRVNLVSHQERCGKTHEEREKLLCDLCPATFVTPRTLVYHKYKVHGVEPAKKYECGLCPRQFVTSYELRLHSRIHSGVKQYQCDLCPKAFYLNSNLREHKRTHELNRPRPFHCANCDKTFVTHRRLKAHMDGVHDKIDRFWCSICNKGFKYLGVLMRHTVTHVEDRSFKCQFCEKSFKQEYVAKMHMKNIHCGERTFMPIHI